MILINEIVDEIKKDISGGISNDDSRFDDLYLESKIHSARAVIISNYLQKGLEWINDSWVQTLDLNYVDRDVSCGVVSFECPSVITIDMHNDGFIYVGHQNGIKPFIRARKSFTTLTMHRVFKNSSQVMWDWKNLELNKQSLLIYNNSKLEYIQVRAIFNTPTLVPGFRKDVDWYPVDSNLKKDIVEMVTMDMLRKNKTAPDYISDSQDKPTLK
jgi:hypothetical protein